MQPVRSSDGEEMNDETKALLKAAYAAGYQRFSAEMCGWEESSDEPEDPLGFEEWLADHE